MAKMTRVGVSDSVGGHDPLHARKSFQQRGDGESKSMYLSIREEVYNFVYHVVDQNSIQYAVAILWDGARVVCKARVSATLWDRCGAFRDWVAAPLWIGSGDTWD